MIQLKDFIQTYKSCRKNKRKSPRQVEFELHSERELLKMYKSIEDRYFQPTAYSFIVKEPKPREIVAAYMPTMILHHYLDERIRPLMEQRMSSHTYNNRRGMGQSACQNAVISDIYEVSKGFTQDAWIVKIDLKGCFPNINQDIAYRQLERLVVEDYEGDDKDELLYILRVCIYSYPTLHCTMLSRPEERSLIAPDKSLFNKPLGIGATLGQLIWQNAVNYYFNDIDFWFEKNGIKAERFVDDIYIIVNNKTFLNLIPELRSELAKLGATINENKFYCQHYTKGCECLGIHIKRDRIYINNRVLRRAKAKIKELNRNPHPRYVNKFLSSINSYMGLCKNTNGYNRILELNHLISPRWSKYVSFNQSRLCFVANPGYSLNEQTAQKYKLIKYKQHDTRRKRTQTTTAQ